MKYIKRYSVFNESISLKRYNNINNIVDGEKVDFYQIPFQMFNDEICIKNKNKEVLCLYNNFYYNFVKDSDIKKALTKDLSKININKDWSQDMKTILAYENINIHVLRIAKLVIEIKNNISITPVLMWFDDRSFIYSIPSYIEDGNHRIRALQFLGYDCFPAYIHGNFSKYLINYFSKNKI